MLYQGGTPIWATMAGLGEVPSSFAMQTDCNAVVYAASGYVWASWTNGQGSSCYAKVVEGDWFICSGTSRVWSARGGGDCGGGGGGDPLSRMARIGENGEPVAAYLIHMFQNTEFTVGGTTRTLWDMTDHGKMLVALGNNGGGEESYRVIFHYTPEGHSMIAAMQWFGSLRYRNTDTGEVTGWIGFTLTSCGRMPPQHTARLRTSRPHVGVPRHLHVGLPAVRGAGGDVDQGGRALDTTIA